MYTVNYRQMKRMRIPRGWMNCPRNGELIVGKFYPFKTPLDHKFDASTPGHSRFNIEMLFSSLESMKLKMGLLIDLTNTNRYYDSREVEKHDCRYYKLQCRGHHEAPRPEQTQEFIEICARFIYQNPSEIIGVHCTHGFNRSGFLIAAYLVEKMSFRIEDAVKTFSESRPPGIYRQVHLEEIFTRYGRKEDTPLAPPLPHWHAEKQHGNDNGSFSNWRK